jgi:hypothetical protein
MRRTMALRDYLQVERVALTSGSPMATVSMPLANDFRLYLTGDPTGVTVLYRNVKELATQGADPTDTAALVVNECSQLDEVRTDSGWCPAQPSALRFELTGGTAASVVVEYTSRTRPD